MTVSILVATLVVSAIMAVGGVVVFYSPPVGVAIAMLGAACYGAYAWKGAGDV